MPSLLVLFAAGMAAAYLFLAVLLRLTQDSREPPPVQTLVPFLGASVGSLSGMQKYLLKLRDRYGLPIYTLRMPGQRIYVVNSLPLILAVQRHPKTASFAPIQIQAADAVMGVSPAGNAIIGSEKTTEDGGYLATFVPSTHPALSPGPGLDALNGSAIRYFSSAAERLASSGATTVDLFSWVRRQIFMATTESMYGPENPFRDPALVQAWYDFEPCIVIHMLKAFPSVLARKSFRAREDLLIPAFEKYFAGNGHHRGSLLVQCRYDHNFGHGLRGRDIAATEIGQMVAAQTNSVASVFWMVFHIFSDPVVLRECREEVEQLVTVDKNGVHSIDLARVKDSCPVLLSTWQETLRHVHIAISARVVTKDFLLEDKYLIRKGATVMYAAPLQHTDASLWGPTVDTFDHRRFLRQPGKKRATNPAAFRAFGGGAVLCPGRHFVSTEALCFAALLLLRFDITPVGSGGKWVVPRKAYPMTSSMPTPRDEVKVEIVSRHEARKWRVDFSASSKGMDLTAEDVGGAAR